MVPLTFQILFDLHLETNPSYDHFRLRQSASYLALLDGIGHVGDERLFVFLETQLKRYWVGYFVLGNHEPYHLTISVAKDSVRSFAEKMERLQGQSTTGKFVFLDQTRHDLTAGLTVLGCTLFSKVVPEQAANVTARLVYFRDTRNWNVNDHNLSHQSDLSWLNNEASKFPGKSRSGKSQSSPTTALW